MSMIFMTKNFSLPQQTLLLGLILFALFFGVFGIQETQAAISFVGSVVRPVDTTPSGADTTLDLSTLGLQENDLVIITYSIGDNDSVDFDMDASASLSGAGYTE